MNKESSLPSLGSEICLGIDASRNRSGGAIAYLRGLLGESDPRDYGINRVHLWAPRCLNNVLPEKSWLTKHNPPLLERSLAHQAWWQAFHLHKVADELRCDLLFATDASTLCRFDPLIVMAQDMLSYEPGIMGMYGFLPARLRLELILNIQNYAFRRAFGVIFLSRYARRVIGEQVGRMRSTEVICHGLDDEFRQVALMDNQLSLRKGDPVRLIYVSNTAPYKNHLSLLAAIEIIVSNGVDIELTLVGAVQGALGKSIKRKVTEINSKEHCIRLLGHLPKHTLIKEYKRQDIIVFASSCESMPVTLLEGMATGIPIACSNRGPMPEALGDCGIYFDPTDPLSISAAIASLIDSQKLRVKLSEKARRLAMTYTWKSTSSRTWSYISHLVSERSVALSNELVSGGLARR